MTVTALDPRTALIVLDLQKGIAGYPFIHPLTDIVARSVALAGAFRARGLPVVLVNVGSAAPGRTEQPPPPSPYPPSFTELMPDLQQQASDHLVTKPTWGAFTGTGLEAWLQDRGVTQVVLTGVATSIAVESTARFAHELGFNVTLAVDAMTDRSTEAHDHCVTRIFPRLGETGSTQDILELLAGAPDPR